MTDRIVLERFVEGNDHDAFRVLIDRHGAMVLAVCRSILREKHDAEDAFQTTFLTLARRAATIKKSDSVAPWLHRVALRVSHRVRHRESRKTAPLNRFDRTESRCARSNSVIFPSFRWFTRK